MSEKAVKRRREDFGEGNEAAAGSESEALLILHTQGESSQASCFIIIAWISRIVYSVFIIGYCVYLSLQNLRTVYRGCNISVLLRC